MEAEVKRGKKEKKWKEQDEKRHKERENIRGRERPGESEVTLYYSAEPITLQRSEPYGAFQLGGKFEESAG